MAARVTIKTIARDLGVSHMTVSRALSDNPNVQDETRKLVRKRAAELGYIKNAAATAMRGDGTRIIGLLLPNIVNEFYAQFANDLARSCERHGFQLIIHLTSDDASAERKAVQQLREVQAKAIILVPAPAPEPESAASLQDFSGLNVVQLIRQRPVTGNETAIILEDASAISDAVVHLHQRRHERIAFIGGGSQLSSGRNRLEAFRAGLKQCGLKELPTLIRTAPPSFEMGATNAHALLEEGLATAIVCAGFEISNGALDAILTSGRKPGRDMAFVGYGDPSFYTWIEGGISTIRVPVTPLADQVLQILESEAQDTESGKVFRFPAEFVIRKT